MEEAEAVLHSKLSSSGKKEELCEKLMRDLNEGGFRDQVIKIGLDPVGVLCNLLLIRLNSWPWMWFRKKELIAAMLRMLYKK